MNRTDFHRLFAYSDNCWLQLGDVVPASGDNWDSPFQTTSPFNTVRLLLAHSIAAEERMISFRVLNIEVPVPYDKRAGATWDELYTDQQTVRAQTYAYMASLTDAEITGDDIVIPATVMPKPLTRADVLFHILNHENYHRGQIISELQRRGFDPPYFDYVLLKENN